VGKVFVSNGTSVRSAGLETGTTLYSTAAGCTRRSDDFDGDGKADIPVSSPAGSKFRLTFMLPTAPIHPTQTLPLLPDLATSVTNSLGGSTTVVYKPSSNWTNNNLPFIVQNRLDLSSATAARHHRPRP